MSTHFQVASVVSMPSRDAPASLICRYCSDGTGRPAAQRERFVAHGTVGSLLPHLFELDNHEFEAHFLATDTIDLHRDNLPALFGCGDPSIFAGNEALLAG